MAKITIECSVTKRASKCYRAYLTQASGDPAISGDGASDKAARDDLAQNLAWLAHVTPEIVQASGGIAWLVFPHGVAGNWQARRITSDQTLSRGCAVFPAESWSKASAIVAAW